MLSDLEFIKNTFDVKYAPKQWKHDFCGWDLSNEYERAKHALLVDCHSQPGLKEFHKILKRFFNSTKDYHVGVAFYSTEQATLPFTVKGSNGRYFVVHVDRDMIQNILGSLLTPSMAEEGDEILTFGGRPVDDVIQELKSEFGGNTSETDQALAELILTSRNGRRADTIPQGEVEVKVRKRFSDDVYTYVYTWDYTPEKIADATKIERKTFTVLNNLGAAANPSPKENEFLNKMMISPLFQNISKGTRIENKYQVGARSSFVPRLGKKVWETDEGNSFEAYVFMMPSTSASPFAGKKIGYLRIPHYVAGEDEAEEFCEIISQFQWRTEALVIDQVNNPGGSLFYLYALAAMLTDKPLYTPKHHILLTQQEVYMAQSLLAALEEVNDDITAKEAIGETLGGYPVSYQLVVKLREFSHFIVGEWETGNHYCDATYIFGIDTLQPHPKGRYTKPVLVLTNSLDFSGGDFFPAILQDNKRVKILGTRTAGAGGYVSVTQFPNRTGIMGFMMTASHAERIDQQPIENLGITPDIFYECTPDDIEGNYEGYAAAILKGVETILKK